MVATLQAVLGFLIILGPLVLVHELGHYLFARLFHVKAEVFSVGFGPRIWGRKLGETEWRVSWFPLGGYVKLLGEDRDKPLSAAEAKRSLHRQEPWKRFLIFFGGPFANFVFAVVVLMAVLVIGEPQVASVLGRVVEGSPAAVAGLKSGDRLVAVEGEPIQKFEDFLTKIQDRVGQPTQVKVARGAASLNVQVTPTEEDGFSPYGEPKRVGTIEGIQLNPRAAVVGVSAPQSVAGKAGLKTGMILLEVGGKPLAQWEDLERIYAETPTGGQLVFKVDANTVWDAGRAAQFARSEGVAPSAETKTLIVTLQKPAGGGDMAGAWGLYSSELFVRETVGDSPAKRAGVQPGDRLIKVGKDSNPAVRSFVDLRHAVQKAGEEDGKVRLVWERAGQRMEASIVPTATAGRDALLTKTVTYTVGVVPLLVALEPATIIERVWNPLTLLYRGTERMLTLSWRNLVSFRKMLTGDVSVKTLGGPIMIARIAGESLVRGITAVLTTMAIFSVGLGVLNILPIPVLDGGHLMILMIESIRRKPLNLRTMEVIQMVGLCIVLMLMVLAFKNDFTRLATF